MYTTLCYSGHCWVAACRMKHGRVGIVRTRGRRARVVRRLCTLRRVRRPTCCCCWRLALWGAKVRSSLRTVVGGPRLPIPFRRNWNAMIRYIWRDIMMMVHASRMMAAAAADPTLWTATETSVVLLCTANRSCACSDGRPVVVTTTRTNESIDSIRIEPRNWLVRRDMVLIRNGRVVWRQPETVCVVWRIIPIRRRRPRPLAVGIRVPPTTIHRSIDIQMERERERELSLIHI